MYFLKKNYWEKISFVQRDWLIEVQVLKKIVLKKEIYFIIKQKLWLMFKWTSEWMNEWIN